MGDVVDAVQVGLIPLVIQVLAPSVGDLDRLHRGIVETQRGPAVDGRP